MASLIKNNITENYKKNLSYLLSRIFNKEVCKDIGDMLIRYAEAGLIHIYFAKSGSIYIRRFCDSHYMIRISDHPSRTHIGCDISILDANNAEQVLLFLDCDKWHLRKGKQIEKRKLNNTDPCFLMWGKIIKENEEAFNLYKKYRLNKYRPKASEEDCKVGMLCGLSKKQVFRAIVTE